MAALECDGGDEDCDEDEDPDGCLHFDCDVAAAAASRTFLHVADLQRPPPPEARRVDESDESDQSDQSCEEAAFTSARRPRSAEAWSAEARVVPDVTAPSDAALKQRLENLDALALELERELDDGQRAMEDFQNRAADGLVDAAARNYELLLEAAERVRPRELGDREFQDDHRDHRDHLRVEDRHLRVDERHRDDHSPPPPPMTRSAELRAADGFRDARQAIQDLEEHARGPPPRTAAHATLKKQHPKKTLQLPRAKPRPQWRDPKGTALW